MVGDSFGLLGQLIASISQVAMFLHVSISRPEPTLVKKYFVLTPTNYYFQVLCGVCRDLIRVAGMLLWFITARCCCNFRLGLDCECGPWHAEDTRSW